MQVVKRKLGPELNQSNHATGEHAASHDPVELIGVFVDTPLDVAESRDPKGLYKKARQGQIPNFTGISSPYEAPESPEIHLKDSEKSVDEQVKAILSHMKL